MPFPRTAVLRTLLTLALALALASPAAAAPVAQEIDFGVAIFERTPPAVPPPGDLEGLFRLLDEHRSYAVHAHLLTAYIGAATTGARGVDEVRADVTRLLEGTLLRYHAQDPLAIFDRAFAAMHIATYNFEHFPARILALAALADMGALLQLHPLDPWPHLFATIVYATVRDVNVSEFKRFDPLDELKKALSFDSKSPWFHYLVGQTFLAVSQDSPDIHQLAFSEFQAARELSPENPRLGERLHEIFLKLMAGYDARQAKKPYWLEETVYEFVLAREPDNAAAKNNLGYLYARGGVNLTKAVELTEQSLATDPDNAAYLDSHGFALARAGRMEEGLAKLRRAHELAPADEETLHHLADLHLLRNENAAAVPYLKMLLEKDPRNELLNNNLAYTLSELNQELDEALRMVNLALEFAPGNPVYLDTKAWIYFKTGMSDQAMKLLDEAVVKDPSLGALYLHRGDIHFFEGRLAEANGQYRIGMRLEPDFPYLAEALAALAVLPDLQARLKAAGKPTGYEEVCKAPFEPSQYRRAVDLLLSRLSGEAPPAE